MVHWHTVYDFADRFPKFGIMAFLLAFVAVGWAIRSKSNPDADENLVRPFGITKRQHNKVFDTIFAAFAGLMALLVIPATIQDYLGSH